MRGRIDPAAARLGPWGGHPDVLLWAKVNAVASCQLWKHPAPASPSVWDGYSGGGSSCYGLNTKTSNELSTAAHALVEASAGNSTRERVSYLPGQSRPLLSSFKF